jgi:hypothetical protein
MTERPEVSLGFIQAVNNWQIGGSALVKRRRGLRLKELSRELDERFRIVDRYVFRRIALSKFHVAEMGENQTLPETIASWTFDLDVAKGLKGGIPDDGEIGVIFVTTPRPEQVIVNLASLYRHRAFVEACAKRQHEIKNWNLGIGKWWDSQREVVLEVESLPLDSTEAVGGRSSNLDKLARRVFGRAPTTREIDHLLQRMRMSDDGRLEKWIAGDTKERFLEYWVEQALLRREQRRLERERRPTAPPTPRSNVVRIRE